jgi:ketopantoate reductase
VRAVEVDHMLGNFIERGGAHGVATQLLKAAFVNLRLYQGGLPKR